MSWFRVAFDGLPDPRTGNALRHDLLDVLTIALTASVCGAESCTDFADFARDRRAPFGEFLRLENGPPSHDTFSRVFRLLDPRAFARCFELFLGHLGEAGPGVLAIDGKTLRRSFDRAAGRSPLHVVTAFAAGARLALGQRAVGRARTRSRRRAPCSSSSTSAARWSPATPCTARARPRAIVERGGDWLFALKGNRPALLAEVERFLADPAVGLGELHVTTDADHGRVEVRRHRVSHEVDWLRPERRVPGEATLPGLDHARPGRGRGERGRRDHAHAPAPRLLGRARRAGARPGRARALGHRGRAALGPRRHLRRGPRAHPQGPRPGEPRHPAQARPQRPPIRPARHLDPQEAQALRVVRRVRQIHPRSNAIAVDVASGPLASAAE